MANDNQEKQNEEELENANNRLMTTVAAKIFQEDKGLFIQQAGNQGRTPGGQLAYMIRKFNRGELTTPDQQEAGNEEFDELRKRYDQANSEINRLNEELTKVQNQRDKLTDQLEKVMNQYQELEGKAEMVEKYYKTVQQLEKNNDKLSSKVDEFSNKVSDQKAKLTQKESDRKSAASQRDAYIAKAKQMQYYINRHAQGFFRSPHQFIDDVPLHPDEPEQ